MSRNKKPLTVVSVMHYVRLVYRSVIFIFLLIYYISSRMRSGETITDQLEKRPAVVLIFWAVFVCEMILRFFPSQLESPGCQKQFRQNYIKTGKQEIIIQDNHATMLVALIWISFNGIFGALHMIGLLDDGIMILLCSFYSVCDMICILFFCPFQSWLLENKCCSACRIYNWDYAMMFTPLFFIRKPYTWSLLVLSVGLMAKWEITYFRHPERFSENTNAYLQCKNCTEKLCTHKKQLKTLWKNIEKRTAERVRMLRK